ncbi:Uncharacterised protein [Burkholderia pseudomallei]|nr:Uncharacterised protein [Burkholderia pseudomallei]CAK0446576.1 Uncharacterised protein [Burkholderia pseudomallei]CAK0447171.1 Uncharacterised protein [Burkholderia pseudomallei]VBF68578.1 Uncharacterised protein [Burkholderia pseudomallei]
MPSRTIVKGASLLLLNRNVPPSGMVDTAGKANVAAAPPQKLMQLPACDAVSFCDEMYDAKFTFPSARLTNSVVAILVLLSSGAGVVPFGAPVNVGESSGAF